MEQIIKIFENEKFGRIRTITKDGEPWFVLADVCRALEIRNSRMVAGRLDRDELMSVKLTSGGQRREMTVINESGFYAVIIRSDKPQAQSFRKWLTSEVIPTIRRTGGYVSNEEMFIENYLSFLDEPYKNLFRLQMTFISKLNERIRNDKPLVDFALHVADSEDLIDMNAMAKLAADKNFNIGRTRLFRWLKEMGVLMSNNLPYQRYIDRRYFVVKESVFEVEGMKKTYRQTFVTGKGQLFIIGLLRKYYGKEIS
ncbi:phage antirepressor [Ruminococcus bicirculans (ex Wegman et al. 2014)]|uniref:phage antirepressor n=1 Tax=Ruminococcus TaxID=1263 RepID=UPI003999EDB5